MNEKEIQALFSFLDRVDLKGKEVSTFQYLKEKIIDLKEDSKDNTDGTKQSKKKGDQPKGA